MIAPDDITGIILCGGAGRRLGFPDKPLTVVHGAPMVAHVRDRLAPQVREVLISANDPVRYAPWGRQVISDHHEGAGPLAGLAAVLTEVSTPFAFCCPGDAPLLDGTLVARLAAALDQETADVAMPHDGHRSQQLFLCLRTALRPALEDYLAGGGRAVLGWTDTLSVAMHPAGDIAASFLNVNTPADLALAAAALAAASGPPSSPRHVPESP